MGVVVLCDTVGDVARYREKVGPAIEFKVRRVDLNHHLMTKLMAVPPDEAKAVCTANGVGNFRPLR